MLTDSKSLLQHHRAKLIKLTKDEVIFPGMIPFFYDARTFCLPCTHMHFANLKFNLFNYVSLD